MKAKHFIYSILLTFTASISASAQNAPANPNSIPADRKIVYAEKIIESYYIDDIDGEKLAQEAIVAMLKTLDPHSSYSDPEETREMTQPLDGNFSGIGIQFNMLNDTLMVIQTTSGGPSEKVGILPGDKILKANKKALSGAKLQNSDIIKTLRGPKGTRVDLEVIRRGVDKPIEFTIIRDDIPINSLDAAFMADKITGYIKLSRFAESTDREVSKALADLSAQGMKNLIIDLQDNGGGYLGSAVSVAGHFLNANDLITYTESPKFGRSDYRTDTKGDFTDGNIVVLVNEYSASASEILSGALQDHDRALIVGRRTFGKGLVQRPFPFPDGSMIKLTVSRYHTPSGRSIQKPYEKGNAESYQADMKNRYENGEFYNETHVELPDSLRFLTLRNKRSVYGGGGIMPDLFVPVDTTEYSDYYRNIVAKGLLNRYTLSYVDDHRAELKNTYKTEEAFINGFTVTPAMLKGLTDLATKEGVEYNAEQLKRSKRVLEVIIKGLIGRDLFESSTYYRIAQPQLNPAYRAALDLINDPSQYKYLLDGSREKEKRQANQSQK